MTAIGIVVLTNAISYLIEVQTLKKKGYSGNPPSNIILAATGNRFIAAGLSHLEHIGLLFVANPTHSVNIPSFFSGDGGRLFTENFAAISIAYTCWNNLTNILIQQGRIDPLVRLMGKARMRLGRCIQRVKDSVAIYNQG